MPGLELRDGILYWEGTDIAPDLTTPRWTSATLGPVSKG